MTITFGLAKISPRFKLGKSLITKPDENKLPEVHPRKALRTLASTPNVGGKISTEAIQKTPQLQEAAKEILGTISQAARFSQHPEVLNFIKEAEKEFPKIREFVRDNQLKLPSRGIPSNDDLIRIYLKDGEIKLAETKDKNLKLLNKADYVAFIDQGVDPEPKTAIDLMKIIEVDGQKIQANIMPFKHGSKRIDLRMHSEETLATTPVFQIFLDKNNSVYDMWMHPDKFVRTPQEINDYPASINPAERKLSINVPPGHTNVRIRKSA